MFTSVCKRLGGEKAALLASAGCLVAAQVYQAFGHGERSLAMTLCFLPSLAFALIFALTRPRLVRAAGKARRMLGAAAATLTTGLFLQGVLEIAGTDSPYLCLFYLLGAAEAMLALGLALETLRKGART